jgi:dehydrogenase/reductase SDR family protein 7
VVADGDLTLLYYDAFSPKKERLRDRVIWITGASSGIGEYLAYELARIGARLILSARREEELERVKRNCVDSCSIGADRISDDLVRVLPLDLKDFRNHRMLADTANNLFGKVDILVNNAGRSQRAIAVDTDIAVDRELLELNTLGTISLTKAILPFMVERHEGHIVVVSSVAGKLGAPVSASYSASKFALQGFFNTLRMELLDRDVKVTIVCPGPVVSKGAENSIMGSVEKRVGETNVDDSKKMSTERCASLMAVAIANRLSEVWISKHPVLLFVYLTQYMPTIAEGLAKVFVPARIRAFHQGIKDVNANVSMLSLFKSWWTGCNHP